MARTDPKVFKFRGNAPRHDFFFGFPRYILHLVGRVAPASGGRAPLVRPIVNCQYSGPPVAPLVGPALLGRRQWGSDIHGNNLQLGYLAEENQKFRYLLTYSRHSDIQSTRTRFRYPSRKTWISIYTKQIIDIHTWISIMK